MKIGLPVGGGNSAKCATPHRVAGLGKFDELTIVAKPEIAQLDYLIGIIARVLRLMHHHHARQPACDLFQRVAMGVEPIGARVFGG